MTRKNMFRVLCNGRFFALAALLAMGLLFNAAGAQAGCGIPYKPVAAPIPFVSPHPAGDSNDPATIVGLWHVIYTASWEENLPSPPFPSKTPFTFLESYKTWHRDQTEFENAFLAPSGGNICLGVWKEIEDCKVKLHHIGLMFDSEGNISNVFTVDETDTVDHDGKTYTGFFDFKLFLPTDVYGTGTPLAEAKGTTAGTRISVD